MSISIHEETAELWKELLLDSPRFGVEGVVVVADQLEDTQTSWTSKTQSNALGDKESLGPSWYVCCLGAWMGIIL